MSVTVNKRDKSGAVIETYQLATESVVSVLGPFNGTLEVVGGSAALKRKDVTNKKIPIFPNRPLRWVAGNNSLTHDYDYSGVEHSPSGDVYIPGQHGTSFAEYLPALLGQRVILVNNAAVSGTTIQDFLERFDLDVAAFKPDIVTLFTGTNSIKDDAALTQAQLDYATLCDRIEAIGAVPIGMSIPPIPGNMGLGQFCVGAVKPSG